jgi:hypothetical protein
MEKKIKKVEKKVTKKNVKKESKPVIKKEIKKNTKKEIKKKEIKKKEKSYFIALLKKRDLIFISWKIDAQIWKKRIETAEKDPDNKQYLYIDISSIGNGKYVKIESLPVNGLENNWHIFTKNEYCGKRIVLSLSYRDKKGKFYNILSSEEIDIPYSIEFIQSSKDYITEESILLELSEIKLAGLSGYGSTSW